MTKSNLIKQLTERWSYLGKTVPYQLMARDAADVVSDLLERVAEGHGKPCYYCGKPCNSFAGNPGLWPVGLCHKDEPGKLKWHHEKCVMDRLEK